MELLWFLILFPILAALLLLVIRHDAVRNGIVWVSGIAIAAASVAFAVLNFSTTLISGPVHSFEPAVTLAIDVALVVLILGYAVKYKKVLAGVLSLIQLALIAVYELCFAHHAEVVQHAYIADKLSLIMVVIIGVIGSSIAIYALGYMKEHVAHHPEQGDRRPLFFAIIFAFLSAMFVFVLSNNLPTMLAAWEVTTVASFVLIGFTRTPEAIHNSFVQIVLNLLGGLAFLAAVMISSNLLGAPAFDALLAHATSYAMSVHPLVVASLILLVIAGVVKSAQMPFHYWLLGAMVAPTPVSALLHSSTMVKAGVYLVVRLAPALGPLTAFGTVNYAGVFAMFIGGLSFVACAFLAITQSNAKRVLAYSTISNLGLIVACAGIGTPEAVWAAIFLIVFHAVTKSLLFLTVGSAEHAIGSRDIEDMDGLFARCPKLSRFMVVGIVGMFVAPFGMLISKWAAFEAFILAHSVVLIVCLIFGSAATFFFWTKWLAKIVAVLAQQVPNEEENTSTSELSALFLNALLTVVLVITFPLISAGCVVPWIAGYFHGAEMAALEENTINLIIMAVMTAMLFVFVPVCSGRSAKRRVSIYMAGENMGDNLTYRGSMQKPIAVAERNFYLGEILNEKRFDMVCALVGIVLVVSASCMALFMVKGGLV